MMEILITMVIVAFGLLGIAAMQALGMRQNHSAYLRTQATNLANEYSDMLRANIAQVEAGKFGQKPASATDDPIVGFTTVDTATGAITPGIKLLNGNEIPKNDSCLTATGCTPAQMAENDLYLWAERISTLLPSGMVTTTRDYNDVYTVSIYWLDDRNKDGSVAGADLNNDGDTADGVDVDGDGSFNADLEPTEAQFAVFSTSFQPWYPK